MQTMQVSSVVKFQQVRLFIFIYYKKLLFYNLKFIDKYIFVYLAIYLSIYLSDSSAFIGFSQFYFSVDCFSAMCSCFVSLIFYFYVLVGLLIFQYDYYFFSISMLVCCCVSFLVCGISFS